MLDHRTSPSRPEVVVFILLLTVASIVAYLFNSSLGEAEFAHWLDWVEPAPLFTVLLFYGLRASVWREIFIYTLVAAVINLLFIIPSYVFEPAGYTETVDLFFGEPAIFWIFAIIVVAVVCFIPLAIAFSLKLIFNFFRIALLKYFP